MANREQAIRNRFYMTVAVVAQGSLPVAGLGGDARLCMDLVIKHIGFFCIFWHFMKLRQMDILGKIIQEKQLSASKTAVFNL